MRAFVPPMLVAGRSLVARSPAQFTLSQGDIELMRTPLTFALLGAFALAGCSGGGSGTGLPGTPGSGTPSAQDVAQSGAMAATDPIEQGDLENGLTNGSLTSGASARFRRAGSVCTDRTETTVTIVSSTETIYDVKFFYDAACTEIARDASNDVVTSATGETIARTATNYNLTGTVLTSRATDYAITGTPSSGSFTQMVTSALTVGTSSSPTAQIAWTDTFAASSATNGTISGSAGRVLNPAGFASSYGQNAALSGVTWSVDGSGNVTFAGTRTGELYKGAFDGLTLATTAPFTVAGGSQIGGSSVTGSVVFDASGNLTSVSLSGTFMKGDTLTVTSSGSPLVVSGTIASGSATVATFTLDQYGDGTITYANGSQGLIYDWHVVH
jgi:hypothetical protein